VDQKYWDGVSDAYTSQTQLVEQAFAFLLSREPKESILQKFNIRIISKYFPEYEDYHHGGR